MSDEPIRGEVIAIPPYPYTSRAGFTPRALPHGLAPWALLLLTLVMALAVALGVRAPSAQAQAPVGAGFNLNASDIRFILQQIKISEAHANGGVLSGPGPFQVENPQLPFGLRTVDGRLNNLQAGQAHFGAADLAFPRMLTPRFRPAEANTSYAQKKGTVVDSRPRVNSNAIVDQSPANPAAVAAAGPGATPDASNTLFVPNVAPDVGLSAPYNSWFTLFGQFFDHGLDLTNKGADQIFMPLQSDDPLYNPSSPTNFMVLTRATDLPGPDGKVFDDPATVGVDERDDNVHEATNQTSPFVDQNQTYASHPSHQVFLREYVCAAGASAATCEATIAADRPSATGKMLTGGAVGGMGTWLTLKNQARTLLGIDLDDEDVLNVPLLATDQYGRFLRGPNGYPQMVLANGGLSEGDPAANAGAGVPVDNTVVRTGHAFLDDIAHLAKPTGGGPDSDTAVGFSGPAGTYDNELLDAHFVAGDGRVNENIGLTAVHHVFHSEHNRLVDNIKSLITSQNIDVAEWQLSPGVWNGERIFQAAKFVTEMEYQHLVFEEFGRKVQPQINVFDKYHTDINPAIVAEFAHTVYRFGHSMLTETVARTNPNGTTNDIPLLDAFLNPTSFMRDGAATLTPDQAAGSIVMGMSRQVGNELDEFVTNALRNRLLGLPLDLATINMARGRETGIPGLNAARRQFYAQTNNSALKPYESWAEFGLEIKHPESLPNFIAAYGTHPSITGATGVAAKRAAAQALLDAAGADPAGPEADFVNSQGAYANCTASDARPACASPRQPAGWTVTGLDDIDFWVGGLAEKQMPFGGLLGNTFNFVFETQLENLQDGDRFYYLSRTAGLNLLTQLEGNSFSELIMRNTNATGLAAEVFSRPDFVFNVANLGTSGPILNDPSTPDDESTLLTRLADGTIRFNGPEHVIWNGTPAVDKVHSSEGDDTFRGNEANDRFEGAAGNDQHVGGDGDDVLTDTFGDDVIKGGDGNDTLSSGQGFDLNQGNLGDDVVLSGSDPTETFGGPGGDYIIAGGSFDTVFGDDGDDWLQGGGQADLLQGDNGAPFQNDPNEPGNDVINGEGGDDDYDSEGGDDIMVAGPGIERNEGMLGFDWVTHKNDPQPANDDMFFTGLLPPTVETLRDRFDLTESMSGWQHNDILRGDNSDAASMVDHELDAAGIARISGLQALLGGGATGFTGGNIVIGGEGSDILEGRGGNDLIDGDRWLNVQLEAPNLSTPDPNDRTRFDGLSGVQADLLAGRMHGGELDIIREIVTPGPNTSVDTAVYSGPRADYDVDNSGSVVTVEHARGTTIDGRDRLTNVERLTFADQTLEIVDLATNTPATGTVTISDTTPAENQPLTVSATITDPDNATPPALTFSWQAETQTDVWTTVATGSSFTPGDLEVGVALRVVVTFIDGDGVQESLTSVPTAAVTNVNDAPTGAPVLDSASPQEGVQLTATTSSIQDADGLPAVFLYQWQQTGTTGTGAFTNIAGANAPSFTPAQAQAGRRLRLVVSYTDLNGTNESLTSAQSVNVVGRSFVGTPNADTFTGTSGADIIRGNGGNDTLNGGDGNDTIVGGPGDDNVNGGNGNDVFQVTGTGDGFDQVNGNAGNDRIEATQPNTNIGLRGPTAIAGVELVTADPGLAINSGNTPNPFPNVVVRGSSGADTISFSGNVALNGIVNIDGNGGNDTITGSNGNDTVLAGPGDDTINTGNGDDTVLVTGTGDGFDTINGGGGTVDRIAATADNTQIGLRSPTAGSAAVSGVEFITGDSLNLPAPFANVRVVGSTNADTINVASATLVSIVDLNGADNNDAITGTALADKLLGGIGNDTVNGGGGDDVITGGAGTDTLNGGAGNDQFVFDAGFGADTVSGFDANPTGGQDLLNVSALGINGANFASSVTIAASATVTGATQVTIGTNTITLTATAPANVTATDFSFTPAP